jgi:hypothetical protein
VVILEIGNYEKQGYSALDIHHFFEERNYSSFAVIRGGMLSRTDNLLKNDRALSVNRVLIPDEKLARIRDILESRIGP